MHLIGLLMLVLHFGCTWFTEPEDEAEGSSDFGLYVRQTIDDGFILVGQTSEAAGDDLDAWLIKTDRNGLEEWRRTFGGARDDWGYTVQQSTDSGYIFIGSTQLSGAGESDVWLLKTDPHGVIQWERTFGGGQPDYGYFMQEVPGGGYILLGETSSMGMGARDAYLIRTDGEGNLLWSQTFGDSSDDIGYALWQTDDGGYVITGFTDHQNIAQEDLWVFKTDAAGAVQWERVYDTSFGAVGRSILQTMDGNYVIAGFLMWGSATYDFWLVNVDSVGNLIWDRTFGWDGDERAAALGQTSDGGFIMAGLTSSVGAGLHDAWLVKTDGEGTMEWERSFGGTNWDIFRAVQQTGDGGYIMAGTTQSFGSGDPDAWLIKSGPDGVAEWSRTFDGTANN
jgi:hypothetical protein